MIAEVLKSLLSDAYDAWYGDQLSAEAYKQLSRLVMDKADELSEAGQVTTDEWGAVEEENLSNLMLIDDVADL